MDSYKPFIEELVKAVVEFPDQVQVNEDTGDGGRLFMVNCSPEDVGKVIGKSGRVIAAIRSVVSAAASKNRERVFVKIVTNED